MMDDFVHVGRGAHVAQWFKVAKPKLVEKVNRVMIREKIRKL